MNERLEKLSAYIDGELTAQDCQELEAQLAIDPALADELAALQDANALMLAQFNDMDSQNIPADIIRQIEKAELEATPPEAANLNYISRRSIAAGFAMLIIGGAGGYALRDQINVSDSLQNSSDWLMQVANYHGIYAEQKRHLVEVGADESAHIVSWLSKTTQVDFAIPDISANGFEFKGARLLAVDGKPVAQLMYKNSQDKVIAICFKQNSASRSTDIQARQINAFNIASWQEGSANFLVIGDSPPSQIRQVANQVRDVI